MGQALGGFNGGGDIRGAFRICTGPGHQPVAGVARRSVRAAFPRYGNA